MLSDSGNDEIHAHAIPYPKSDPNKPTSRPITRTAADAATSSTNRKQKLPNLHPSRAFSKQSCPAATSSTNQRLQPKLPKPIPSTTTTSPEDSITTIPTTFQLNVNGIAEKSQKYKIKALDETIQSSKSKIPYFVITESHLKKRHYDHEIAIKNYTTLRADRPIREKGGVVIYMHSDLVIDDKETYTDTICQAAMIFNAKINLIIIGIYRPPRADDKSFQSCITKIDSFIAKYPRADIQIMGDLNFPYINWETKEVNRAQLLTSEVTSAHSLIYFMEKHLLTQMVKETTRADKSILDLVITNNDQAIHSIQVEKTELSDHDIVWTQLSYKDLMNVTPVHSHHTDSPLDNLNLNKANFDEIRRDLSLIDWDEILKEKDVTEINTIIYEKLVESSIKHAPSRTTNYSNKPNIPGKRRSLLNIKRRLNQKINKCKYLLPHLDKAKLDRLNKKKAEVEIKIRDAIREEAKMKEKKAIEKIKANPRAFFTYSKSKSKTTTAIGPLLDKDKKLQTDPLTMSNILQDQYTKVFSNPDSGDPDQPMPDTTDVQWFDDIKVTPKEIITAINEISPYSAPGPDKIPAVLIKECKNEVAQALAILWRKSLDSGQIPPDLLRQTIIPIFKKENKSLASNYRPISLTSHLIKIFERVFRDQFIEHLESNNLITTHQHGFRIRRSTFTQLLHHIDNVLEILENHENADIIYLDLAKAFDKVNHKILLSKLKHLKVSGKALTWIENFLSNRTQQVVVDGIKSKPAHVQSGVPQGTVLGPALFIVYMNNVTEFIKSSIIKLFADDSKLIASIKDESDREKLLDDLNALIKWTDMNSMRFNEDKFQLLQIGPHNELKQPYSSNNIQIEKSSHVKDLGIYLSEDMSCKYHISQMTESASNFASWLLRTFITREKEVMLLLLKTYLVPRLEYCSPVWSPTKISEIEQVESVQRSFTRNIENLEGLNYHDRLKHLKLFSLQRRRERFIIIHTFKIYKGLAPNDLNLQFHNHPRLGPQCKRLPLKSKNSKIKTLRFNFYSHAAPRLFNLVPGKIKKVKSVDLFKNLLDKLLFQIPDTPPTPGYKRINSNSLTEWGCSIQAARVVMASTEGSHLADDGGQSSHGNTAVTLEVRGGT